MPSIGITGIVGSGKSFALEVLKELGAETICADRIGHALLEEEEVIAQVVELLGVDVLDTNGNLDRSKIGGIVFGDAEKLKSYNALIHPLLLGRLREWLDSPRERVAAVEAALIPEWGIESWFDEVWVVECSDEIALSRWNGDESAYRKIRTAQFAPEKKKAKAERVIENERSQEEFRRRIREEWKHRGRIVTRGDGD